MIGPAAANFNSTRPTASSNLAQTSEDTGVSLALPYGGFIFNSITNITGEAQNGEAG
jgi:hypothetical protein